MSVVAMKQLLEAGVHFGHQTRRWDPRMAPYIFTARNGIYIIDLQKTTEKIIEAYEALKSIVDKQGKVIFVGTKKNVQEIVQEEANRSGSFYATYRWLGGTLTNFSTIKNRATYLRNLIEAEKDGSLFYKTKKEIALINKEKEKLEKNLGGIKEMRRLPNAMIVIDPLMEVNAVKEAKKLRIPVFGICDTNSDPTLCDYVIPANDDSTKAVKLILQVLADAIVESKGGDMSQILVAYTKDETSATMDDVIANADAVEKERQERKAAEAAAKKAQYEANQKNRFGAKKQGGRQFVKTTADLKEKHEVKAEEPKAEVKEEVKAEEVKAEEVKTEEVKEVKKAVKKTTKKVAEPTEEKAEEKTEEKKPAKKTATKKTAKKEAEAE